MKDQGFPSPKIRKVMETTTLLDRHINKAGQSVNRGSQVATNTGKSCLEILGKTGKAAGFIRCCMNGIALNQQAPIIESMY